MDDIVIGKHTLESLTSGMYSDPFVVYREYIQNAADSIDAAIQIGLLQPTDSQITINLSPIEHQITICDNGAGISIDSAEKTLVSIGNSKKASNTSRGFRGIGRLSALSYCSKLTFETSSFSEDAGTRIIFDAQRLAELLSMENKTDSSVAEVIRGIYSVQHYTEKAESHYFRVFLDGVHDSSELTDYESVVTYIEQNAPVPYDPTGFVWGKEIVKRLKDEGYSVQSYNVDIVYGNKSTPIYKPYRDEFWVDKSKSNSDKITDIRTINIRQSDGALLAIGWIAKTNYLGSIYDKAIKGIRLRKGNILVGDGQTLNVAFKDARFNGWSIGEVYAIDAKLIPNARRDNLEKNQEYFLLFEHLLTVASEITRDIRSASLLRNAELSNSLKKTDEISQVASRAIDIGVNGSKKGAIRSGIIKAKDAVSSASLVDETGVYFQEIAFDELDMLIGKLQGATSFKTINMISSLNKTEKKVLERVFDILVRNLGEEADDIIELITNSFAEKEETVDNNKGK